MELDLSVPLPRGTPGKDRWGLLRRIREGEHRDLKSGWRHAWDITAGADPYL
jgi:hypothetical protein